MNKVNFTKMHSLGNDFVVIDSVNQDLRLEQIPIEKIANRHLGIGFDQLLIIEPAHLADFYVRIFNADSSEAEQCGNGLRCIARYIHETKMHTEASLSLETKAGIFPLHIKNYDQISMIVGYPEDQKLDVIVLPTYETSFNIVSLGNPHAILNVQNLDDDFNPQLATFIASHATFTHGANVGFMQILSRNHIRLRTIERGAGETFACGSNAIASFVTGIYNNWLDHSVKVEFKLGSLLLEYNEITKEVTMTGPAVRVYDGVIT